MICVLLALKIAIKSNCGGVLSAAVIAITFPLMRIYSRPALACAVQLVAFTVVAETVVTVRHLCTVVQLALLPPRYDGLLQTHVTHFPQHP